MDRRQLLKDLLGLGIITAVEPKKTFILPPANGWRQEGYIYTPGYYSFVFKPARDLTDPVTFKQGWLKLGEVTNFTINHKFYYKQQPRIARKV